MNQRHLVSFISLLIFAVFDVSISPIQAREIALRTSPTQWFEPNLGQTDSQFAYVAHDRGYRVFLGRTELAYSLMQPTSDAEAHQGQRTSVNVHMQLVGANANTMIVGEDVLPGVSNYLNEKGSFTNIPHYGGVRYRNLYNGIDMTNYRSPDGLQYDFHVAAGSDPNQIRLHFTDVERLEIAPNGDLLIHAANNSMLTHKLPYSYQMVNGLRQEVHTRYRLLDDHTVGYEADSYDGSRTLVIDPPVVYSTYIGSETGTETSTAIAVDAVGSAYITGQAQSDGYPITPGSLDTTLDDVDVFVTKFSPDGSTLIYSTYLGGSEGELAYTIAVDPLGNAYVLGFTQSSDFTITANAFQTAFTSHCFVSKLNAAGNGLLYSTFFGDNFNDGCFDMAVDHNGSVYLTGRAAGDQFPLRHAAMGYVGGGDAFVSRLDTNASGDTSLIYSTFLGGASTPTDDNDLGHGIDVDDAGNAYIVGTAFTSDFPTTANAYDRTFGGVLDAFIARINTNADGPASLVYSSFLGGTAGGESPYTLGADTGGYIAVDHDGSVYITGTAYTTDFPTTVGAFDRTFGGPASGYDAFVAKFNTNVSGAASLIFASYLGGDDVEEITGIDLSLNGAYVVGYTASDDFPTVNPVWTRTVHSDDIFVTDINMDGSALTFSTYYGGSGSDHGLGVAVDPADNVYFTGFTMSNNFPTTVGAFDRTLGETSDGFLVKLGTPITVPARNYFTTLTPTLTWNRVSWARQYTVQVSKTKTFATFAFTAEVPSSQLEVTTDPLDIGTYYWRVSANNGLTWSAVDSFTVTVP
ncbi:MAG: SBBP repeat-containing protein [Anaerolineae bacterium]|nr:SBBP repeat-containing protein [Anaerolineae bacterium]